MRLRNTGRGARMNKKKTIKEKVKSIKITFNQQMKAFIDVVVANRKYYWIYRPHSWMVKDGDSPRFLGDSLIKAHLQGKEKDGFIVCLGLSMFVDNYNVLYGALDFDVHGYTPKQRELKLKEFGGDEDKLNKDEDKFKEKQRKQIKEDLPKICGGLDKLNYLYYLNSSGSEGIHLRVYCNKPINARVMRYYLKDLQARLLGDSERHEVFPKQDELNENTPYGNQMKGVIAVHPKTKRIAGIIKDGEVLDRKQSLNYLIEFAKKIQKAKIISFEVTEEIRKKYEKKPIVLSEAERIQINDNKIPYYCGSMENGEELIFPRPMHDSGMDIQAWLYYQDKPNKFARWKEMQGREDSAFNGADKGVWLCNVQQKYYKKNKDNEAAQKCIKACMSCPHCYNLYIPDLKPLIQNLDNPEKKNRIIQDILKSKVKTEPLELDEVYKQINELTGIDITILKKQFKRESEKVIKNTPKESLSILTRRGQIENFWNTQPFYYDKSKIFYLWNKELFKWEISDEVDFCNSIYNILGMDTINRTNKGEIVESFKQVGRMHKPKDMEKSWVQFKDRIYDIKTGKDFEATPQHFVTNPIPYKVGGTEETPIIDGYFNDWMKGQDKSWKQTLYEIMAYNICRDKFMQRIIALCGGGANGKGTYAKLNYKFLGSDNCVASEIKNLSEDKFEPAVLYKKLLCVMGEVHYDDLKNTNQLKKLGGEDKMSFQFKGKTPFTEDNTATCLCLTNTMPITPDKTIGFYRKWLIIDFPNQFKQIDKNLIDVIPEEEFENLAKKLLRILKELYVKPHFTNEGDFDERAKRYEERSNPIMKFIEDECIEEPGEMISLRDFTNSCNEYLKSKHLRIMNSNQVGKVLRDEGFVIGKRTIDDISAVVIVNVRINNTKTTQNQSSKLRKESSRDLGSFDGLGSQEPPTEEETIEDTPRDRVYQYIKDNPLNSYKDILRQTNIRENDFIGVFEDLKSSGDILESKPDKWMVLE